MPYKREVSGLDSEALRVLAVLLFSFERPIELMCPNGPLVCAIRLKMIRSNYRLLA